MKKHYLIIAAAMVLLMGSCSSNTGKADSKENRVATTVASEEAEKEHYAKMLTKAEFLEKVMNYEKNTEEWVFEGKKPALIDFYADWCAPCRITSPILEELAKEYDGKIDIYKIDTEQERELAMVFGIQSIPSFLYVPMEGRPTMSSGIAGTPEETKQMFRDQIDNLLLNPTNP